jgi:hypothetical protein
MNLNNYTTELTKDRIIHKQREQSYQITSSKEQDTLEIEDVELLNEHLKDLSTRGYKYLIRIMNSQRTFTVKGYSSNLELDSYENYYINKVKDPENFDKIHTIFIQILHP